MDLSRCPRAGCELSRRLLSLLIAMLLLFPFGVMIAQEGDQDRQRFIVTRPEILLEDSVPDAAELERLSIGALVWGLDISSEGAWRQVRVDASGAEGWLPLDALHEVALLFAVTGVVLRDEPAAEALFVRALPAGAEVWAFDSVFLDYQLWRQVWTTGGVIGWAADDHFAPRRVTAAAPLSLAEEPGGEPALELPPDTVAVVLETTPDSIWTRLQTPQGLAGWTSSEALTPLEVAAAGEIRLDPAYQERGANVRAVPGGRVIGTIAHETDVLVIGRDSGGDWLQILAPEGYVAWIDRSLVRMPGIADSSLPVVSPT